MYEFLRPIQLPGRGTPREINNIVLQSPLSGVTDRCFRKLIRKWAPEALLFTEMVNATSLGLGYGIQKIEELAEEDGPIGVQLYDFRPKAMVKAAKKAESEGAFLIDINMGCPVKKIANKGGGSALIKDKDLAAEIVNEVSQAVKIPVTIKTRLGWTKETSAPEDFAIEMQKAGAQLITIHGRTRDQGFKGKSNWQAIASIKKVLEIPLIANGDINNPNDAIKCLNTTKADGIMIGRGSLGKPWLIGYINSVMKGNTSFQYPSQKETVQIAIDHLKELIKIKGDHGLLIARKHLSWTCQNIKNSKELRSSLMREKTPLEAIKILERKLESME
tara:strand:- start:17197 stop:18192 length:996 start_codon:yes stop_codon:yes gene_type:complete